MKSKLYILSDWKHYLGWTISTLAIYFLLSLLGKGLNVIETMLLFLTIIFIDAIKHTIDLQ